MLKKLFGGKAQPAAERELTIDDLVVLERYDEAIDRLEAKLRLNSNDLHSHLRMAEVLVKQKRGAKALDEYLFVADSYTDDGFYDKAIALLTKIQRLSPGDEGITAKILKNQRLKDLEHSRVLAIEGLIRGSDSASPLARTSPIDAQKVWNGLATSAFVERLSGDQLRRLFESVAITDWRPGEVVAERGSGIERLFLIASGVLEAIIPRPEGAGELQLRTFASGDVIGERALFEHRRWPATYRVVEHARLLRVDRASLEKAMSGSSDPRGLLEALRSQHHDRDVAAAVEKLLASPA
jgi:CRP-like cAMP-binding protein